jgi:hypothetical protein
MNSHVTKELIDKYPNLEFRGKSYFKSGKKYIKARYKDPEIRLIFKRRFEYSFEEDFFWFV